MHNLPASLQVRAGFVQYGSIVTEWLHLPCLGVADSTLQSSVSESCQEVAEEHCSRPQTSLTPTMPPQSPRLSQLQGGNCVSIQDLGCDLQLSRACWLVSEFYAYLLATRPRQCVVHGWCVHASSSRMKTSRLCCWQPASSRYLGCSLARLLAAASFARPPDAGIQWRALSLPGFYEHSTVPCRNMWECPHTLVELYASDAADR
jgi:hypothetical protein